MPYKNKLHITTKLFNKYRTMKVCIEDLSLLTNQEMDQYTKIKTTARDKAHKAVMDTRKEIYNFRKKVEEIRERVKQLIEAQKAGNMKAIDECYIKLKAIEQRRKIIAIIKNRIKQIFIHTFEELEKSFLDLNTKCIEVLKKLNQLFLLNFNDSYQVKQRDEVLRKTKELIKFFKHASAKEASLKNKKEILEHDIEELNATYNELVKVRKQKRKSKSNSMQIALITSVTIVSFHKNI